MGLDDQPRCSDCARRRIREATLMEEDAPDRYRVCEILPLGAAMRPG
jgi:hypothetical protein